MVDVQRAIAKALSAAQLAEVLDEHRLFIIVGRIRYQGWRCATCEHQTTASNYLGRAERDHQAAVLREVIYGL
jgi:hypothetical protein